MAKLDLTFLGKVVPEFQSLVLDRLPLLELLNLANVNKFFKAFVCSCGQVMEKTLERNEQVTSTTFERNEQPVLVDQNVSTQEAIITLKEDLTVDIFHLKSWKRMRLEKSRLSMQQRVQYLGIICGEECNAWILTKEEANQKFLTIEAQDEFGNRVQEVTLGNLDQCVPMTYDKNTLLTVTYNVFIVPLRPTDFCLRIIIVELRGKSETALKVTEKWIRPISVSRYVQWFEMYQDVGMLLCNNSIYAIHKNGRVSDHKHEYLKSHAFESSGSWLIVDLVSSSTFSLINCKSGKKFNISKEPTGHGGELTLAADFLNEDRVIIIHRSNAHGDTWNNHYKVVSKDGAILRKGCFQYKKAILMDFCFTDGVLILILSQRIMIIDTSCNREIKIVHPLISRASALFPTRKTLTFTKYEKRQFHLRKLNFAKFVSHLRRPAIGKKQKSRCSNPMFK